jgi:hypothetical protein
MKKMVIRLTPELREQLRDALESNASEMTISFEDELNDAQLDKVQGGNVNSYLLIDSSTGPSTSKTATIDILSFSSGTTTKPHK